MANTSKHADQEFSQNKDTRRSNVQSKFQTSSNHVKNKALSN